MSRTKSNKYPTKTTLNLAIKEKSEFSPFKVIPAVALIIVLAALFSKYCVVNLYLELYELQAKVNEQSSIIDEYNASLVDYDLWLYDYMHRSNNWMTEEELSQVDYNILYPMLEKCVYPHSDISNISLQGNILSLNLVNLSLQDASNIIQKLTERDDVLSVTINTANRNALALTAERTGSAMMIVTLTNGYEKPATVPAVQ